MRRIEDALNDPESKKEDIVTIFLALQKQNFVLSNSLTNLLKHWPTPTTAPFVGLALDEFTQPEK